LTTDNRRGFSDTNTSQEVPQKNSGSVSSPPVSLLNTKGAIHVRRQFG
jgi:hypothetical protein